MAERILFLGITPLTDEILLEAGRLPRRYRIVGALDHTPQRSQRGQEATEVEGAPIGPGVVATEAFKHTGDDSRLALLPWGPKRA